MSLAPALALGSANSIALKEPAFRPCPEAPAPAPAGPKPAFKETNFPLASAENYREVLAATGPLSPAEADFLEKNRFLLRPRTALRQPYALANDEMLAAFDSLGGPLAEHLRRPDNARFIGPDVFIHALSRYLGIRRAAAEAGPMRKLLLQVTEGLYNNAAALRAGRVGRSADNWERFMAQLLVPLVILEQTADGRDDLEAALARLDDRRPNLAPGLLSRVRTELRRVCLAQGKAAGLLGLTPADSSPELDYTLFRPRGVYEADPEARAYFRAAAWFQRLGWDIGAETGLADALNFVLALSCEPPTTEAPDPRTALARLMELSGFLYGPALTAGWAEWAPFLMKEAEVPEFTADTAAEAEVLDRLREAAEADLRPKGTRAGQTALVQLLPRRMSWPRLLAEELTSLWPDSAPPTFSALWLPTLWRHSLAEETIGRQLALTAPESVENRLSARLPAPAAFLEKAGQGLKDRQDDYWFSSLGAAWWPVWTSLTGRYGPGLPLYMRSRAFAAKELETIFGGLANLKAPPAPSRPVPAPDRAEAEADKPPAPLVKGFVEPNQDFWLRMNRLVKFIMTGFQHFDIFPEDLEEEGALRRFLRRLERAAEISGKELAGLALTGDDYEFIRLFTLDWMAAPYGPSGEGRKAPDGIGAVLETWSSGGTYVYEATAEPWLILVLVGNENSPRLTMGLAYNHYEFISGLPWTKAEELWRRNVSDPDPEHPLPPKNFWYEPLWPAGASRE